MYGEYTRQLIDMLPNLPGLDRAECRRALSATYFHIIRGSLVTDSVEGQESAAEDLLESQDLLRRMVDALESVAVFDRLHGQESLVDVDRACAFVAGEALALLSESWRVGRTVRVRRPRMPLMFKVCSTRVSMMRSRPWAGCPVPATLKRIVSRRR